MCPQKRTRWIFCKKDIGIRGGFKRNRSVLEIEFNFTYEEFQKYTLAANGTPGENGAVNPAG